MSDDMGVNHRGYATAAVDAIISSIGRGGE